MPRKSVPASAGPADGAGELFASVLGPPSELAPLELAARFGVSRRRVYDWLAQGWLRGRRLGGRWRVSEQDAALFETTCRGYRGRLMPSLYEWERIWPRK